MNTSNFVAYHSTERMGYKYGESRTGTYSFWSRKSRTFLERAIGNQVSVITGNRNEDGRIEYHLVERYTPEEIQPCADGGHHILGFRGQAFRSPPLLNSLPWFRGFLRAQNNFSFGFNSIRDEAVVKRLEELMELDTRVRERVVGRGRGRT